MKSRGLPGIIRGVFLFLSTTLFFQAQATGYFISAEMNRKISDLAKQYPDITRLTTFATTPGNNPVYLLEIGKETGQKHTIPAVLVVGNPEGDVPLATSASVYLAESILKEPDRYSHLTWYIIPALNPDALELFSQTPIYRDQRNAQPHNDDMDDLTDEDGFNDLDGNGIITMMRVKDPEGQWIVMKDDPRIMRRANPAKGEKGVYKLYTEGIDEILKEEKIRFFFTDTHGVLYGRPRPKYAVYAPVYTKEGVAVFARDVESSMQVWSAEVGYPGDYRYREFYRDLGFDLPYNYIRPHLHSDGIRRNVGIKYHRITGRVPLNKKEYYVPQWAQEAALTHARHFMWCRERQSEWLYSQFEREPVIVCPYDAELYGHWWFEGPDFLYYLFKELQNSIVEPVSPSQYLKKHPHLQVLEVCPSTWGDKGYNEVWLNGTNDWIYRHLHFCVEKMIESAQNYNSANPNKIEQRVLNQMARELLLAESSDWAFIMTTGTTVPYAHKRTKTHISNFLKLYEMLKKGKIDENFLKDLEHRNNIFPHINWRVYA